MVLDNVGGTVNFFHLTSRPTIIDPQFVFSHQNLHYTFSNQIFFIKIPIYKNIENDIFILYNILCGDGRDFKMLFEDENKFIYSF